MKYLESYNNFYYQEIPHDKYYEMMGITGVRIGLNRVPFTESERSMLEELFKENLVNYKFDVKIKSGNRHLEVYFDHGSTTFKYGIDKVNDEWFLVFRHNNKNLESKNWMCDQIDGLIRLLEDQKIIL